MYLFLYPLGDPVPPKARILEVWVWVMSTKSLVKIFWHLGVRLVLVVLGRPFLNLK
jgi:hypothetical protein